MKKNISTLQQHSLIAGIAALALVASASRAAAGGAIPYPNSGNPNPTIYSFTASSTGDLIGYFAGSGAGYDEQVGLLDNGVQTSAGFGLDDHTSSVGQSFDFGPVTAGDTLVFDLNVNGVGTAYSDPSMNTGYDFDGTLGHNHIYSTDYEASSDLLDPSIPSGTYVGFEDLQFPASDFNYFDDTFVFTDVSVSTSTVPDSGSTVAMLSMGLAGLGMLRRRFSA